MNQHEKLGTNEQINNGMKYKNILSFYFLEIQKIRFA